MCAHSEVCHIQTWNMLLFSGAKPSHRGTFLHAFQSQYQNLELNPFPDGQPVKIFSGVM